MKHILKSEKETKNFAKNFAKKLKGSEVIALIGDLGAGKTVFTKGLAKGLGIKDIVSSPTFVLMKCYKGKKQVCHIDAYRLNSAEDLINIGLLEYLKKPKVITIIEWADKIPEFFEKLDDYIEIKIEHGKKEGERVIEIFNS